MFGLSLLNTLGLATALAAPLLIFAYLRKEKFSPVVVPSILVLKKLSKKKTLKRKFRPPLNFFFEILALLLLAIAAANPIYSPDSTRVAIVFDNSLSMRASNSSVNVLERAKISLEDWLEQQSNSNVYDLFTTAGRLKKAGESLQGIALRGAIAGIKTEVSSDRIVSGVRELASSGNYQQVLVVSDRSIDFQDIEISSKEITRVRSLVVEGKIPNAYIKNAKIVKNPKGGKSISLNLKFDGVGSFDGELTAKGERGKTLREISRQDVSITSSKDAGISIDIPRELGRVKSFKLELRGDQDGLAEDNVYWLNNDESNLSKIALVSSDKQTQSFGLEFIPGFSVRRFSPREYSALNTKELQDFSLLIFHRSAPSIATNTPTLLILPPKENPFFPTNGNFQYPKISSFNSQHQLTSYLKLELLKPSKALTFETPVWAQSIIGIEEGAILVAGESQGIRFAASGIELLPFESRRTPAMSILTLNLLRWLSNSEKLGHAYRVNDTIELAGGNSWIVADKAGVIKSVDVRAGEKENYRFTNNGIFSLTNISGDSKASVKSQTKVIAVNNNFVEESNTYNPTPIAIEREIAHDKDKKTQSESIWPLLSKIAVLLLLIELLLRARKPKTTEAAA